MSFTSIINNMTVQWLCDIVAHGQHFCSLNNYFLASVGYLLYVYLEKPTQSYHNMKKVFQDTSFVENRIVFFSNLVFRYVLYSCLDRSNNNNFLTFHKTSSQTLVIIQLSYTVRIPIFWLADLYQQPPWRHYRGVNSTPLSLHHGFGWLKIWRFLLAVYSIWIVKRLTHSLLVNYRDLPALVH